MNIQSLQNIGLSENESKIYLCLLELGKMNISQISEKSGCNRMQIYESIPRLVDKNILGETRVGKRKYYFAKAPESLENIFKEKEQDFRTTIHFLKEKYQKNKENPDFTTLQGIIGIQKIFDDITECLEFGDIFYRYSGRRHDSHKELLKNSYRTKRDEKKLERLVITNHELEKQKEKKIERQIVSIPKNYDLFEDNISKIIYKDRVAIIDYNTQSSFIIRNKKFADFEKKIFKLLFKFLKY